MFATAFCVLMECTDGFHGQFRNFRKDDFEAEWTKVAECRFGQVYRVKLKVWQEKCALKSFHPALCSNNSYRWDKDISSSDYVVILFQMETTI